MTPHSLSRSLVVLLLLVTAAACAPRRIVPPRVATPLYPEYLFPNVPPGIVGDAQVRQHNDAWQFLQGGDVRNAERGFTAVLKRTPQFYPAETGLAYVALAQKHYSEALERFDRALQANRTYVAALAGRGETLLSTNRNSEALASFEAALKADPSLSNVARRIEVLRFRVTQDEIAAARAAAQAGRDDEARQAYERSIAASPQSAFLYRELAVVEQRQGQTGRGLELATKAAELDPSDGRAFVLIGEFHEARGDTDAALAAYQKAVDLQAGEDAEKNLARLKAAAALAALPDEYRAIVSSPTMTRGELAALVGIRFPDLLGETRHRDPPLVTDTRSHWATQWILAVTAARVMEVYSNHTFLPNAPVRRGELALVLSRLLDVVAGRAPEVAAGWQSARGRFRDIGPGHLHYRAASRVVAAGVLAVEDESFHPSRPVSGADAIAALDRVEALWRRATGR